jgi:RNA-directed DNA polymerase
VVDGGSLREGQKAAIRRGFEESDAGIVPKKPAKTRVTPVESVEGRAAAEGKSAHGDAHRAQDRESARTQVERIGQRAKEKKGERFNNLLSAVKVPLLTEAYQRLCRSAAPGVDGITWEEYGEHLDARLLDLQDRIHRGSYHPQPVRRVHIPKGDGGTRPLGIPALEDKIVQQAVRMVLEPIYEREFKGFSYGFRPGRSQHDALNALAEAISRKVNWVLDADIRAFFDTIDHEWMQKFIEHRIGDRRLVRLVMKLLHAGVMEDGELREVEEGTPQGGNVSPLLANIYLHYALDLWVHQWRTRHARGEVYIVRYADDCAP